MIPKQIKSAKQLETTPEATCDGFRELAAVKTTRATPHVAAAIQFFGELEKVRALADLPKHAPIRESLSSAAGISMKARSHLRPEHIDKIILSFVEGIPAERKQAFREEVFYRYLLIRGASLDGEMRNYIGAQAARVFVGALLAALAAKHDPAVFFKDQQEVAKLPDAKQLATIHKAQKIVWDRRILLFDKKPKVIGNNVDMILLNAAGTDQSEKTLLTIPERYLACGELKGGIDPAGADEHWKTARTAIDRINQAFAAHRQKPAIFFVGAAIESAMAQDVFARLSDERLTYAANLTVPKQVADLAAWLVSL